MDIVAQALENIKIKRQPFCDGNEKRENELRKIDEYVINEKQMADAFRNIAVDCLKSEGRVTDDDFQAILNRYHNNKMQIMKKYGYPPDYLEKRYYCDKCKDHGVFCSCVEEERKRIISRQLCQSIALSGKMEFDNVDLDFYPPLYRPMMSAIFNMCKNYADTFSLNSISLFLFGGTGLGKTHFSVSIAKKVIENGFSVIYCSSLEIFRRLEREKFANSYDYGESILTALINTDLLVFDDLGVEIDNKYYKSCLYEILENRINRKSPTIVNSNLDLDNIRVKYGDRIRSRLASYMQFNFIGDDIRMITNVNNDFGGF